MKRAVTYKTSGVDINKAEKFVRAIKGYVNRTTGAGVLKRPGAFGSLFALDARKYKNPVLVSSTDGVGTKLLIAKLANKHDTVGVDLVAMNVNDILCAGARPLFFLDYIACGKLDASVLKDVIKGIVKGCRASDCSLIGGETAEMPGMYKKKDYDLAGFAVGIVDKSKLIDGSAIRAGDSLIGLPSSGLHSNGFSLVRKVFSAREQRQWARELLAPTRIYVKTVLPLLSRFRIHGMAHITGGAFYDKLTKILPQGKCFVIDRKSWNVSNIFQKIQKKGRINNQEMFRTFNMGIGLVLVVPSRAVRKIQSVLLRQRSKSYVIGEVERNKKRKIIFRN